MSEQKNETPIEEKEKHYKTIRVSPETKLGFDSKLNEINSIFGARRIGADRLMHFALSLVTEEHIKMLQKEGRNGSEKMELWRQIFIKKRGPISFVDFLDFISSKRGLEFMEKNYDAFERVA